MDGTPLLSNILKFEIARPMMKTIIYLSIATTVLGGFVSLTHGVVKKTGDRVAIVDRWGEHWDVTQAESIGFKPERFQYGIGRNAIKPLNDTHLTDQQQDTIEHLRIIGVKEGDHAQAYSVPRLVRHEIANTTIGSKPIAVGY